MSRFEKHRDAVSRATVSLHGPERVVAHAVEEICIYLASEEKQRSAASEESEKQLAGKQA